MKEDSVLDGSVEEQCKELTRCIAGGVKQSNSLSGSESHEYLSSVSSEYRRSVRKLNKRVLKVLELLVGSGVSGKQVDEVFDSVVEYAEDALEVALTNVEEIGRDGEEQGELSRSAQFRRPSANLAKHHLKKPQLDFDDWPIDNSDTPFIPVAERKNPQLSDSVKQHVNRLSINNESVSLKHPYENDILQAAKSSALLPVPDRPRLWGSFEKTEFTFVEDEPDFEVMLEKLLGEKEIAVDLENHSERSYQGFCCLMQISTRSEDFVIDAIKLRSIMNRLLPIFSNPKVVKVLHGANHDVQWLERDFGLYIVNLFDTFASTKLLELQGSLAFLLEFFCDVKNSNKKKFQRSDWRVRPLPGRRIGAFI
uniref:3'-5' exonuclease domain-containing protein n=1 Tax=Rhodosorus marinus TaxID=101924 RepID=A0A7S2ZFP6_9RHOD|mmetsp:Transcript_16722/g.68486  ORF Transcript_16722/g.68486 Transcript_16722/m.68486 type:complete len:366 (+) Transcript_16722:120-1217(+)